MTGPLIYLRVSLVPNGKLFSLVAATTTIKTFSPKQVRVD
jgi:hypothetical protein